MKLIRSLIAFGHTLAELPRERILNIKVWERIQARSKCRSWCTVSRLMHQVLKFTFSLVIRRRMSRLRNTPFVVFWNHIVSYHTPEHSSTQVLPACLRACLSNILPTFDAFKTLWMTTLGCKALNGHWPCDFAFHPTRIAGNSASNAEATLLHMCLWYYPPF